MPMPVSHVPCSRSVELRFFGGAGRRDVGAGAVGAVGSRVVSSLDVDV